jgi:hypothetical protein
MGGNEPMESRIDPSAIYLCNPDVVLREEDEDGGLLFNPDTNQVKVLNITGLFIWKQFASPNQLEAVVEALRQEFEEVPASEVESDVIEFLSGMIADGFIGILEQ